ncbi:MAG: alpha/beta hydrolase, partial [Litorimonas sp.]
PRFTNIEIIQTKEFGPVLDGTALMEQWQVEASFGGAERLFHVAILRPSTNLKAPLILSQNFCPNHAVIPIEGLSLPSGSYFDCSSGGLMNRFFGYFFGRYITTPPLKEIMQSGYGFAAIYPHEFSPDSRSSGLQIIAELFPDTPPQDRPGALAIWSAQSIWIADQIKTKFGIEKIATYGHSRFGKTALIAAAYSDNIDAVIAHQSGTGGASVLRDDVGESVAEITEAYPQWFSPRLEAYGENPSSLPIDAQHLLALVAPRPVLLGNARRDVWSDPNGAFLAAQQADGVWKAANKTGLNQNRLKDFDPKADIAFWQRPGTHGVVKEDWEAFLEFLNNHFQ